ncbi:hypothetical protein PENSPDRAFT_734559 [Peniophora sp. CONT]|nr:hypothetical protein PENSPDRAFT_734559 [Peniophora sp. CONT]
MTIFINPPDTEVFEPSLNLQDVMGTWYVTHSTLPMWKSKKDVTITYSPLAGDATRFDDVVEYRSLSSSPEKKRTQIVGVDTLVAPEGKPSVRFKWRGRGWLVIASSQWQLLGYGNGGTESEDGPAWAVTFFEKTMFTPAGLDIYARTAAGLPDELVDQIKSGLTSLGGQVGDLAGQIFALEHTKL